ncbi:hypothetical protein ASPVEDRAFT_35117 [Aspergillus versicolor CBS 583.65]|uniref:Uncharacterized protein n=1 Tax=Aspergillus versicolor CBS 583.65 TaxID=1036611 RepID=A0A1L9P2P2_ASPVE|nr:uncharacterized protein ASPVEDRAFT_35117 [Aspergillus versicolor CBS 583.65]OJI95795.1 hypothetical protein ASPVEDRAFT_35117 [Aspergillus versicolor CBS 583.65]
MYNCDTILLQTWDTSTREAPMRLLPNRGRDDSRAEIAEQARRIGKTLVQYTCSNTRVVSNPDLYIAVHGKAIGSRR